MFERFRVWRCLQFVLAVALSGCADEVAEPQSMVDTPEPEIAAPEAGVPGTMAPESTSHDENEPAAAVGGVAPDFVATGLDGEPVSLSEYLGEQNVVVAFSRGHW